MEVHQACQDSTVATMAFVGSGKRVIPGDADLVWHGAEDMVRHPTYADYPACVRAAGSYYDGADHFKNAAALCHGSE